MRTNLKVFRIRQGLSQEEMAINIGCKRATYSAVENGTRNGRHKFWEDFKKAFSVSDSDMWNLMHND